MKVLKLSDIDLQNKRVLIREDLNVPIEKGHVTSSTRIRAALPTIEYALRYNARVMIMSHLGRPIEGKYDEELSLAPIAEQLTELLGQPVRFVRDWLDGVEIAPGDVVLFENVRFNKGEKDNDVTLAKKMASLCDVFVMDAFATAHRAEASTTGIAEFAPVACAGPLLISELEALSRAMHKPPRPLVAIVGGSKVSTKLNVLSSLIELVDYLIVGGGIANTFIAAKGFKVGKSLYEENLIGNAQALMTKAERRGVKILLPNDVTVGEEFVSNTKATQKALADISDNELILDIGSSTIEQYTQVLTQAGTILWNGPVGVFEWSQFADGTRAIAKAIANSTAFSIAGGGDTLAAIDKFDVADKISYISTGGGAFLEFIEGKKLPALAALETAAEKYAHEVI